MQIFDRGLDYKTPPKSLYKLKIYNIKYFVLLDWRKPLNSSRKAIQTNYPGSVTVELAQFFNLHFTFAHGVEFPYMRRRVLSKTMLMLWRRPWIEALRLDWKIH
ncbi:putative folylpolyglutamate synthase [Trichinella spiralis]|uniref:putative folylpolyglutamate synthase n=1 Tax=Trichinella spiralis TaxID=6334 RepID=UPI0001EFB78A|nr:putative folylpolyglutamate synthase [Trichinella spiralis]